MAKGMKDSSKGRGGPKPGSGGKGRVGGAKGNRGLGSLQRDSGEIKRERGLGGQAREPGEFKDTGGFGGRPGPKIGKELPKKGCFPKLFVLCLPLVALAAYWFLGL